jgi:2-amino-4-hydroxy-6-hydroxymethyldihydropteridine diphosphokinase
VGSRLKLQERHDQAFCRERVFLTLGTNLGDRLCNLKQAINKIVQLPKTHVITLSSVYKTEPIGFVNQPDFLNLAVEIRTSLCPICLLFELQRIEDEMGRIRTARWGPRCIDIDIIYFGQVVRNNLILTVPHPHATNRRFVLKPLNEIAPDFIPPPVSCTVSQLLSRCIDHKRVIKGYNASEILETLKE